MDCFSRKLIVMTKKVIRSEFHCITFCIGIAESELPTCFPEHPETLAAISGRIGEQGRSLPHDSFRGRFLPRIKGRGPAGGAGPRGWRVWRIGGYGLPHGVGATSRSASDKGLIPYRPHPSIPLSYQGCPAPAQTLSYYARDLAWIDPALNSGFGARAPHSCAIITVHRTLWETTSNERNHTDPLGP